MQNGPLGHNFNSYQGQPQQGNAYGMPQQGGGFPGASNAVGVAARFPSGQMPAGLVAPRPGAGGAAPSSVGPQGRMGLGGVPGGAGRAVPPGAVMNGPRGPMPMGNAPASSMGSMTVGGAPVVGSAARPGGAAPMGFTGQPGNNPSGEILAMLMKGQAAGQIAAPGAALGAPGASGATGSVAGGIIGGEQSQPQPQIGMSMDDFPALGGGLGSSSMQREAIGMGGMGMMMGGMSGIAAAKLPQDFNMATEDFPALPGLSAPRGMDDGADMGASQPGAHLMQGAQASSGMQGGLAQGAGMTGLGAVVRRPGFEGQTKASTNTDPFGLLGLLNVIQMTNPDLNTLALGTDLTTLGLNLNSTESLYATFASPWADGPSRREPEFSLPMCYYMQPPTLKSGHIQKFQLETLFYIFYMLPKDTLQAVAASELYSRDWKFHRDLKMWFHKQPSLAAMGADGRPGSNRPNTYIYFDVNVWERRTYYDANKNLEQGFLSEEEVRLK